MHYPGRFSLLIKRRYQVSPFSNIINGFGISAELIEHKSPKI